MDSEDGRNKRIDSLLRDLANKKVFEERLGDALADDVAEQAQAKTLSPAREAQLLAAVDRGLLDGRVARARVGMQGTLGAFGSALRRIRESAGISVAKMAGRAGLGVRVWEELESQRRNPETLSVDDLASVAEAAQLRTTEIADTLRRSRRLRLLPGAQASFRAEDGAVSDSTAAYEDLLAAASEGEEDRSMSDEGDLDERVEELRRELHRRGRDDLL